MSLQERPINAIIPERGQLPTLLWQDPSTFEESRVTVGKTRERVNGNSDKFQKPVESEEGPNVLAIYFDKIHQIPLLEAEEEKRLAWKILLARLAFIALTELANSGFLSASQKEKFDNLLKDDKNKALFAYPESLLGRETKGNDHRRHKMALAEVFERYEGWVREQLTNDNDWIQEFSDRQFAFIDPGRQARNQMAEANLRLVVSIAKKHFSQSLALEDLIGYGNEGLMKAVDRFDFHKGYKFSTYATWWIKQTITRAIADYGSTIRLPVHMREEIGRWRKQREELTGELGREPTDDELFENSIRSKETIQSALNSTNVVSLQTKVGDEDTELSDFLVKADDKSVEEAGEESILKEAILEVLGALTPREQKILKLRFGFEDGRSRTLGEVGREFKLTRERIRQIEAKSLGKLKAPERSEKLRGFL